MNYLTDLMLVISILSLEFRFWCFKEKIEKETQFLSFQLDLLRKQPKVDNLNLENKEE